MPSKYAQKARNTMRNIVSRSRQRGAAGVSIVNRDRDAKGEPDPAFVVEYAGRKSYGYDTSSQAVLQHHLDAQQAAKAAAVVAVEGARQRAEKRRKATMLALAQMKADMNALEAESERPLPTPPKPAAKPARRMPARARRGHRPSGGDPMPLLDLRDDD